MARTEVEILERRGTFRVGSDVQDALTLEAAALEDGQVQEVYRVLGLLKGQFEWEGWS